jgi:hypothetical protein
VAENQLLLLLVVEKQQLEWAHRHRNLFRQLGRNQAGLVILDRRHPQSRMIIIKQKFWTL